ncbi:uncharacterized protein LOC105683189 [Athalia rosae]|uniref:uncharacterized protein LOC105683189 n=1 Tax=Athalia rosae TaxID=37344 RepID=UPI0020339BB5|nr:uncharacterized protein LOC105683189 [Athalia rosae]
MGRFTSSVLAVICMATVAYGMDCSFGSSKNIFEQIVKSCPRPIIDLADQSYCCIDVKNDSFYCCDAEEWALKTGLGIIIPSIIAVVVIISIVVLCISCLCCTCCPWYRRRHRGTVYGNLQAPAGGIHIIQPTPVYPGYAGHLQNQPPVYATTVTAMPQDCPPQYTQEAYTKQAPYNPGYAL